MSWSIYRQQVKYDNGSEAEDRAEKSQRPIEHRGKEAEASFRPQRYLDRMFDRSWRTQWLHRVHPISVKFLRTVTRYSSLYEASATNDSPSRIPSRRFGRVRRKADIDWRAKPARRPRMSQTRIRGAENAHRVEGRTTDRWTNNLKLRHPRPQSAVRSLR